MNPRELFESKLEAETGARLRVLQNAPAPNLARGRARVMAAAQDHFGASHVSRRFSFAFALAVGTAVILMMAVMSNAFGALPVATVAMTRTNTTNATALLNGDPLTPTRDDAVTLRAPLTPVPNIVPEPPRAPSFSATQTLGQ